ncbi:MAG: hypothetical protein WC542_03210 [Paludibacter sp.]|jgi:hypothetical protein
MAQVKIEEIINHLDYKIRKSLEATLEEHFPNQNFDTRSVFRTFKRQISRKCDTWEDVPDDLVERN